MFQCKLYTHEQTIPYSYAVYMYIYRGINEGQKKVHEYAEGLFAVLLPWGITDKRYIEVYTYTV